MAISYITGYISDYTFYTWSDLLVLKTGITRAMTVLPNISIWYSQSYRRHSQFRSKSPHDPMIPHS